MKICILSMQEVNNYGSVLQAYSLKKILEEMGHDVYFIGINKGKNEKLNSECIPKIAPDVKSETNKFKTKLVGKIEYIKQSKMFNDFRKRYLETNKHAEKYDLCVIGSDEVFNCLQKSKWGFSSQLFGKVNNADKVITYAASCGATKTSDLNDDLKQAISEAFENISAFSVRDKNTYDFVKQLACPKKVETNMDPVAIGNFDREMAENPINKFENKKYCVIYSYYNRITEKEYVDEIINLCKKENMYPIAVFGKQSWLKTPRVYNPFEVLGLFKNAEFIITDTFHGCLIGAKYGKKLGVIIRNSNRNKLTDLINKLQINDHVIYDSSDIKKVYERDLNRDYINNLFISERNKTFDYIERSTTE